jgi:hypothetical protein
MKTILMINVRRILMQVLAQMADENDFDDQCEENINAGVGADGRRKRF